MGRPKATLEFEGGPLIARPLAAAAAAGLDAVVVAKPSSRAAAARRRRLGGARGAVAPALGLIAALERGGPIVAVACDMPFVTPEALAELARRDGAAAPLVGGRLEPFPARYEPSALPALRAALEREAPLRAALAELRPEEIEMDARVVTSFNTPEDVHGRA